MSGIKQDRRMHPRYGLRVPVVFQRQHKSLWSVTEDISTGGLFLQSRSPPDVGEALEIRLAGPGAGESMDFRGKVVYRRERNQASLLGDQPQRPAGAGVAFEQISPAQRDRLVALLSQERHTPPEVTPLLKPVEERPIGGPEPGLGHGDREGLPGDALCFRGRPITIQDRDPEG